MTPYTVACQDPLSMGFPRQEYWSGFPFPSLGDVINMTPQIRNIFNKACWDNWVPCNSYTCKDTMARLSDKPGKIQINQRSKCEIRQVEENIGDYISVL